MRKNNFKIIFKNKNHQEIDLDYQTHDSILACKWFKKIKHLKNIDIDNIESQQEDLSDLKNIYIEFCAFSGIKPKNFTCIDQPLLNDLHKLYQDQHEILSRKKDNSILYKFHHSIHHNENKGTNIYPKYMMIGWGIKEGPLTENFSCNDYYETDLKKNAIYLPWAELGKTPLKYWKDNEPNDQESINQLCKPHLTLRAKFFIPYNDIFPNTLQVEFKEWFEKYKKNWLSHHNITRWNEIDEYCAPLLAVALHSEDITDLKFVKILI
jgi:hypothetical protein